MVHTTGLPLCRILRMPQREESLVDPVQVDDVGLLEFRQAGDVGSHIGNVDLEKMFPREMQMGENAPSLPEETKLLAPSVACRDHGELFRLFVAHQHLGLHTVVDQCLHQPVSGNGCPSGLLTCIDNQYSHAAKIQK
jgi:hypothetical protein